jgi:dihydropteroate synthase
MKISRPPGPRNIRIMGVLNVTPDSFSDGSRYMKKDDAVAHAVRMEKDGADIIDIGAESTRPGADDISPEQECERVIPVVKALSGNMRIPISIDTRKSRVAEEALRAGATIVNDVSGLRFDASMAGVVGRHDASVILMHMKGSPKDMQEEPRYDDLIAEITASLNESMAKAKAAGVGVDKMIIDPGIGFGKTLEHNLEILRRLDEFKKIGPPVCVGVSRKSFIGKLLGGRNPEGRLAGTIAAQVVAVLNGADILRAHDVKEAVDAVSIISGVLGIRAC